MSPVPLWELPRDPALKHDGEGGGAGCTPAAAGLPSPSPLSASRGCCSHLFPPPPSRCRSHGNRFGCTPVPRCAPGPPAHPGASPLGALSPRNAFPWAMGDWGLWVSVGHPKMGAVLGWGGGTHPALGMPPPSVPIGEPSCQGGGTALRAGHPGGLARISLLRGAWAWRGLPAQLISPRGWHRDGGRRARRAQPLAWGWSVWQSSCPCADEAVGLSVPLIIQI